MISILITLAIIAVALLVTFVAGAIGLAVATFVGLLLVIHFDPNGLAS